MNELSAQPPAKSSPLSARFLGELVVPHLMKFEGSVVGGLSGIDYNARTGEWAFVSDDRSSRSPTRFYTARLAVDKTGPHDLELTGVHYLRDERGQIYGENAVDVEDIRMDPHADVFWWCQEGNRPNNAGEQLIQPSIHLTTRDGMLVAALPLPENYLYGTGSGPRRNRSLEALSFSRDGQFLISAMEGPLLEDGPISTPKHGGLSRITVHTRSGKVVAQYAYRQKQLPDVPDSGQMDHGVSALLVHPEDDTRLLTLERTFIPGLGFECSVFEVDTSEGTDIRDIPSLRDEAVVPVHKRLLTDFSGYPLSRLDNLEGMTWGPRLPSGEYSLVLISDDGFYTQEVTQIVALAVS